MGFELYDPNDKEGWLGDQPAWDIDWQGEIKKTGTYKIKINRECLEGRDVAIHLQEKKPAFKY